MISRQGNKRPVEFFLVGSGNQALSNTANAGTLINDVTTGNVRLANGQLGVVDASGFGTLNINTFLTAGNTRANAPVIQLVQGTADSANPTNSSLVNPLSSRPFEASMPLNGANGIVATKMPFQSDRHSTWVVGKPAAATSGKIVAVANTKYGIKLAYSSHIHDEMYGTESKSGYSSTFTSPNYVTAGYANNVDHVIQNVTWGINRNSYAFNLNRVLAKGNEPVIAIALDSTGAARVVASTGLGAGAYVEGGFLPLVNTYFAQAVGSPVVRGIKLTEGIIKSIKEGLAAAGWPAGTGILTID
jgi:hypothetical protein